ncbi:MAG TPA: L-histidine N(alpha)-methyltransferase [Alphaproteobacteria bacterium]|nr:L-histidine N(alpha)-methyltransferase [Alphaproteobacteria bacterium]HNS43739.1 L-histidine N(alpha)-methyltransferase [Alphaproteobacteria bacterium]
MNTLAVDVDDNTLPDESRSVIRVDAVQSRAGLYDQKFKKAFLKTIKNPDAEGLLTTHLFYDIPEETTAAFNGLSYDAKIILSGGRAWERHIDDAVTSSKDPTQSYGYWDNDQSIITFSINKGLIDLLPRSIKFVSYGCGDIHAFNGKESQILAATLKDVNRDITDSCIVDILERYAISNAVAVNRRFGISSQGVVGDFLYNGKLAINETRGTPVVMIFGGSFENTPSTSGYPSPQDSAAMAWAKMNTQHGLGSIVIKTFDSNQDPQEQERRYKPTRNFEAFILSAFARAVQQGIILNPQYDVLKNWKLSERFDTGISAVKLTAVCKRDHVLNFADGSSVQLRAQKDQRVITLAHKWDENTHISIAQRAGFEVKETYSQEGNFNKLIVAEAIRRPDKELLELIQQYPNGPA